MKMVRNIGICLGVILLFVPLIHGQDLSKYQTFSLGTSRADVSKQIDQLPADANVIQQSPATIQDLTWRPVQLNVLTGSEPVHKVIFSFYNRKLYKIVATYDKDATVGLTAEDMIEAISARYGTATKPVAETSSQSDVAYGVVEAPIAQWEDAQYSVTLSRGSFLNTFQLVMLTKQLNAQAEASVIEAAKQEREEAPQKAIARREKSGR
jgi:hypothetical protein